MPLIPLIILCLGVGILLGFLLYINLVEKPSKKKDIWKLEKDPIPPNKFMKILIACGVEYKELKEYTWEIIEIEPHRYHCIGNHPVAKRIDIIKENIVIH